MNRKGPRFSYNSRNFRNRFGGTKLCQQRGNSDVVNQHITEVTMESIRKTVPSHKGGYNEVRKDLGGLRASGVPG